MSSGCVSMTVTTAQTMFSFAKPRPRHWESFLSRLSPSEEVVAALLDSVCGMENADSKVVRGAAAYALTRLVTEWIN